MTLPATLPPVIPEPFAQNAGPDFIQNPIPETTASAGRASYDQGWPAQTMQPVVAGGVPPWGQDFNGLMFAVTAHLYYLQSGQRWPFNADVAAAIGGYPVGAIVDMADGSGEWINFTAANTTDPDGPGGYGAGWRVAFCHGYAAVPGLSAGAYTLTTAQAKKSVVVFSGALAGNVAVSFPQVAQEWLLINNTTGPFNLTVNAGTGITVNVPQGGPGSPLGVYSISDGNMYPSVSPLGVPISVPNTPNTLVERDANGYIYTGAVNIANNPFNGGSVINVFYDDGDGFVTKMALPFFEGQMLLSAIGGQVTAGQVPVAAVTQYTPQILASATLTGTPSVPTQATGTSNTTPASTAFVNPGSSLNANGYRKNPDGSIDQWGVMNFSGGGGTQSPTFPIPFPTACYGITEAVVCPGGTGGAGSYVHNYTALSVNGFTYTTNTANAAQVYWRAIGK